MSRHLHGESTRDATTRKTYFVALQTLDMFDGRWDEAVALVDSIASLEERAGARLTAGLFVRPTAAAMRGPAADAQATFAAALERELASLP